MKVALENTPSSFYYLERFGDEPRILLEDDKERRKQAEVQLKQAEYRRFLASKRRERRIAAKAAQLAKAQEDETAEWEAAHPGSKRFLALSEL